MPTLASPRKSVAPTAVDSPTKFGIPPDLLAALEWFFHVLERVGYEPPTPEWFLAEAFGALQVQRFRTSPAIQHFLHRLLGAAYDPHRLATYVLPVTMAVVLHRLFKEVGGGGGEDVGNVGYAGVRWCLGMWGIRDRAPILAAVRAWVERCIRKQKKPEPETMNEISPNAVYTQAIALFECMQARAGKLKVCLEK